MKRWVGTLYVALLVACSNGPASTQSSLRVSAPVASPDATLLMSTVAASSSVSPSVTGQSVTFTAVVSGTGVTPTGSVQFTNTTTGQAIGAPVSLDGSGTATVTTTFDAGSFTITAAYGGDTIYSGSSGTVTQTVTAASTTTTLTFSPNPSSVGSSVTLSATVAAVGPGSGSPDGTVTFSEAGSMLAAATLSQRVAIANVVLDGAGIHTITASYGGSTNFGASSDTEQETVDKDAATVSVTTSGSPSTYGSSVTFTIVVSGSPTPTGSVTISEGTTSFATLTLDGNSSAHYTTSALAGGTHTVTATYSGDSDNDAASGSVSQEVDGAATSTTLSTTATDVVAGQSLTLTATVAGVGSTPTGTITFYADGSAIGTGTLSSGSATLTTSFPAGTPGLTASYGGDANDQSSTSSPATTITVEKAATSTTIASSSNPSSVGSSVTLTGTVKVLAPGAGTPTGTITFMENGASIGSGSVGSNGRATASVTLAAGTHAITAVYGGDGSYKTSTSSSLSQVVSKDGATVALVASPTSSTYGGSVTFTATVTGSGATPTGTITFDDGGATIGSATLSSGSAMLTTSALAGGTHTIGATYGGDTSYAAGPNGTVSFTVSAASTTTALVSNRTAPKRGDPITFTATVTSTAGTPTGTVEFKSGSNDLGLGTLQAGVATLTTSALPVGSDLVTATYAGTASYATSAGMITQAVGKASTTTTLASSSNPSLIGGSVTFTATVTSNATGTVSFYADGGLLGTGTVDDNFHATYTTSTLDAGAHAVSATYGGDGNDSPSTSATITQTVDAEAATVTATAAPTPATYGSVVTIDVVVRGATGNVDVHEGGTEIGSATLDANSSATFTTRTLAVGTHTLTVDYAGDTTYASGSGSVVVDVTKATTVTTLTSSKNPSGAGGSVTLYADVSSIVAGFTGTVKFLDGATILGTSIMTNGSATLTTSALAVGAHALTATYAGDASFAPSTSATVTQVIDAAATPDMAMSPDADAPDASMMTGDIKGGCDMGGRSTPLGGFMLVVVALAMVRRRATSALQRRQ